MIDLNKRVFDHFEESIRTKQMAQEVLTEAAAQAAIGLQPRPRSQDRSDLERPRAASRRAAGRARRRRFLPP